MSLIPTIELEEDEPPKNGEWIDTCDVLANPTEEEMEEGELLGQHTDTEDDEDGSEQSVPRGLAASERDRAFAKARVMKSVLLDYGVPEVSIELRPGRPSPFGTWDSGFFVSEFSHHTVSRWGRFLTPVLSLCKFGRSDLGGPLCNGYGGYDLCYRIITFGYANHPGAGGPYTVPALTAGRFVIPKDSARRYGWGTEWEGGLNAGDWDRKLVNPRNKKSMNMREFMGRVNKGLEDALEIHEGAHLEHSTWTSRKIDRLGYTRLSGIREKNRFRKTVPVQVPPTIDLSNMQTEFRIALGAQKGTLTRRPGVRRIQRFFKLPETGLVDSKLLNAWGKFEEEFGGKNRTRVPDERSLRILVEKNNMEWRP